MSHTWRERKVNKSRILAQEQKRLPTEAEIKKEAEKWARKVYQTEVST